MNIYEIESVLGIINAETEAQKKLAMSKMLTPPILVYKEWHSELIKVMGMVEAIIDFELEANPLSLVLSLRTQMDQFVRKNKLGKAIIYSRPRISIIGKPNAGKSTLLNFIYGSDRSIVSSTCGTTRDFVEVTLDLGGFCVTLTDTAGICEAEGIEGEAVRRSVEMWRDSDLVVVLVDVKKWRGDLEELIAGRGIDWGKTVLAVSKVDLTDPGDVGFCEAPVFCISCHTKRGVDELMSHIILKLREMYENSSWPAADWGDLYVEQTRFHLDNFVKDYENCLVLAAEDLRLATKSLSLACGFESNAKIDEAVFDYIFNNFCVGK